MNLKSARRNQHAYPCNDQLGSHPLPMQKVKHVLIQWFSYRKLHRERPVIGDRRAPSRVKDIQPNRWLPEYTTELLKVLNILTLLVELEPAQADLLGQICTGPLLSHETLTAANALAIPPKPEKLKKAKNNEPKIF